MSSVKFTRALSMREYENSQKTFAMTLYVIVDPAVAGETSLAASVPRQIIPSFIRPASLIMF
jgi:hypothetical protein